MTVSKIDPVHNYNGNGSTTTFDFDFLIENESELLVQHTNAMGIQTTLTLNIDYTIAKTKSETGSYITFPIEGSRYSILGENEVISLTTNLPIEQIKEYKNSGKLNLITLEWSLDYITRLIQQMSRQMARTIKIQEGSTQTADDLIEALQEAQVNAANAASVAGTSATNAQNAALVATEQAGIIQQNAQAINENTQAILTKANTALSNLTDDGKAKFDGDWVSCSEYQIFFNVGLSSSTYSEYTLDFLPDNSQYELSCTYTTNAGTNNGYVRLALNDESESYRVIVGANTGTAQNTFVYGQVNLIVSNNKVKAMKMAGGYGNEKFSLIAVAYRKVGTGFEATTQNEET